MNQQTIDYTLRTTWQAVARLYNEQAAHYEGSMAIGFTLLSIDKDKGTPATEISARMGMEATSLTRTLKTLTEKGLITKRKNPADGRGVLCYLTELGKEKRELSKNTVIQFNEAIKSAISVEKLNHFFEVTETINQLITDKKIF
jgi:DNA-binding MarR family transcriptional regulator